MSRASNMPEAGEIIAERYRLERTLSSGGMGAIYTAVHTQTHRRFALKLMLSDLAGDEEALQRFMREARLAGSINHPCVIRVYDVGFHDQYPYMVMELLEGESLGARLKRGRFSADETAELMLRVLEGVAAAHRVGIVHRDLKPDNIFLCRSPDGQSVEPKVLDFGISKSLRSGTQNLTRTGIALGTPLYMSPEQVHGDRNIDQRADVYALGVILYEMLTGEVPYNARSYAELVLKIITGDPTPIQAFDPSLPTTLGAVVRKAMAVSREDRYPNVDALAADLHAFARGVLLQAPQLTPSARPPESLTPFSTVATIGTRDLERQSRASGFSIWQSNVLWLGVALGSAAAALAFWLDKPSAPANVHSAGSGIVVDGAANPTANAAAFEQAAPMREPAAPTAELPTIAATPLAAADAGIETTKPSEATKPSAQNAGQDEERKAPRRARAQRAASPAVETAEPSAPESYEMREEMLIDPFGVH